VNLLDPQFFRSPDLEQQQLKAPLLIPYMGEPFLLEIGVPLTVLLEVTINRL
jgi:hypothetical protein